MKENSFLINKCNGLFGNITNQTSKNATLPIMSASLLCDGIVKLNNLPNISDVDNMVKILKKIGVKIKKEEKSLVLNPTKANNPILDCQLSKTMRSSLFLLGSMLRKYGEVDLTLPGGCQIGERPIDIHIKALKRLGVSVTHFGEHVFFKVKKEKANKIKLKLPSVGATENIIQFACKLKGKTTIVNAAKEPEVVDLCNFLNQMGAKILGAGTSKITIYGVDKLSGAEYKPIGDRIVAGTIMVAVAITGGDVTINNAVPYQNLKLIEIMRQMGCQIDFKNDIIHIVKDKPIKSFNKISTGFYPSFPTDLQSVMVALACVLHGKSEINEKVFENRFLILPELLKLGIKAELISSRTLSIVGKNQINGCELVACDLRGGASLVLLGLVAKGTTIVKNIHYIDRGYDHLELMLNSLGANIRRLWQKKG